MIPALRHAFGTEAPLVLTSRPAAYAEAVHRSEPLRNAAVVTLEPLRLSDAEQYLRKESQRVLRNGRNQSKWDSALTALRAMPQPEQQPLARAIRSPLMVVLAAAAYSAPTADPRSLLDSGRFPDREAVENHLVDDFVSHAFEDRGADRRTWSPMGSWRWLTRLATIPNDPQAEGFTLRQIVYGPAYRWVSVAAVVGGAVAGAIVLPGPTWRSTILTGSTIALAIMVVGRYLVDSPSSRDRQFEPRALLRYWWTSDVVAVAGAGAAGAVVGAGVGLVCRLAVVTTIALVLLLVTDHESAQAGRHPAVAYGTIGVPLIAAPIAVAVGASRWIAHDARSVVLVTAVACFLHQQPSPTGTPSSSSKVYPARAAARTLTHSPHR